MELTGGSSSKESPDNAGDTRGKSLIPWSEESPGVGSALQSSILAWKIPCPEEPGGLLSMWPQRDMTE